MSTSDTGYVERRQGGETRAEIQRVARELFTSKGYEATSMREIAEALGIKKASLYYHFAGKEEILRSLVQQRGAEAENLLDWIARQPQQPELLRLAVLRWVESFSKEKLKGIRFISANPLLMDAIEQHPDERIGSTLVAIVDALASLLPERSPVTVLRLRMALLSINSAVEAAHRESFTDDEIVAAARANAAAAIDALLAHA